MKRVWAAATLTTLAVSPAGAAFADITGEAGKSGTTVSYNRVAMERLASEHRRLVLAGGPHWKYRSVIAGCDLGGRDASSNCYAEAAASCDSGNPSIGGGPLTDVTRMWVGADGSPLARSQWPSHSAPGANGWQFIGTTCLPNLVPDARPIPTMEMIAEAVHRTAWARGTMSTQPKGNTTLVNLKTFYKVDWSTSGYQPGEVDVVDPATMFGYRVEIRPKLVSFVYHFGDGASFGPTTSPGGVYPDGDVVHTYARPGTYTSRVDATFGAEFRINGGAWIAIPDTVTVSQPGTTVTVREAKAVLVS